MPRLAALFCRIQLPDQRDLNDTSVASGFRADVRATVGACDWATKIL